MIQNTQQIITKTQLKNTKATIQSVKQNQQICCRICLQDMLLQETFIVCGCKGANGHVHQKCLLEWAKKTQKYKQSMNSYFYYCQICKQKIFLQVNTNVGCLKIKQVSFGGQEFCCSLSSLTIFGLGIAMLIVGLYLKMSNKSSDIGYLFDITIAIAVSIIMLDITLSILYFLLYTEIKVIGIIKKQKRRQSQQKSQRKELDKIQNQNKINEQNMKIKRTNSHITSNNFLNQTQMFFIEDNQRQNLQNLQFNNLQPSILRRLQDNPNYQQDNLNQQNISTNNHLNSNFNQSNNEMNYKNSKIQQSNHLMNQIIRQSQIIQNPRSIQQLKQPKINNKLSQSPNSTIFFKQSQRSSNNISVQLTSPNFDQSNQKLMGSRNKFAQQNHITNEQISNFNKQVQTQQNQKQNDQSLTKNQNDQSVIQNQGQPISVKEYQTVSIKVSSTKNKSRKNYKNKLSNISNDLSNQLSNQSGVFSQVQSQNNHNQTISIPNSLIVNKRQHPLTKIRKSFDQNMIRKPTQVQQLHKKVQIKKHEIIDENMDPSQQSDQQQKGQNKVHDYNNVQIYYPKMQSRSVSRNNIINSRNLLAASRNQVIQARNSNVSLSRNHITPSINNTIPYTPQFKSSKLQQSQE